MRLNEEQRKLLAEKLMDLANLAIAGLVFGQSLSTSGFNPYFFASGILFFFGLFVAAMWLRED